MGEKKLKCSDDKKLFGVCGGLAEYFDTDVSILRVLWAVITIFTGLGPGLIVYLIFALFMSRNKNQSYKE